MQINHELVSLLTSLIPVNDFSEWIDEPLDFEIALPVFENELDNTPPTDYNTPYAENHDRKNTNTTF